MYHISLIRRHPQIVLGVCIHSVCRVCISMAFEPAGDMCASLQVGVASAFGTVGHMQQV